MQEPPPPESIASMWPVLMNAAKDGLRRAQGESAEQERIRREGQRIRRKVYSFFQRADEAFGSTVEQYEAMIIFEAADDATGDRTPISSTAEIQAAVNSLVEDGHMIRLPREDNPGPQRFRICGPPGGALPN